MNHIKPKNRFVVHLAGLMVVLSLLVAAPAASSSPALASPDTILTAQRPTQSTPQLIDLALANGEITAEQRLLYLAYAVYEYPSLPARFRSDVGWYGTRFVQELRTTWRTATPQQRARDAEIYRELDRLLAPAAATICDLSLIHISEPTRPY